MMGQRRKGVERRSHVEFAALPVQQAEIDRYAARMRRAAPRIGLVQQEPEGNIVMQRIGDDAMWDRAEAALLGCPLGVAPEDTALQRALDALRASVQPNVDLHASAELRAQIMAAMLRQALLAAWARLPGTGGTDQRSGSHA